MKLLVVRLVNISLLIAFVMTLVATPFMKIHFFKELHEIFGVLMFILTFAHIFIYRKSIKVMFKKKNQTVENIAGRQKS